MVSCLRYAVLSASTTSCLSSLQVSLIKTNTSNTRVYLNISFRKKYVGIAVSGTILCGSIATTWYLSQSSEQQTMAVTQAFFQSMLV